MTNLLKKKYEKKTVKIRITLLWFTHTYLQYHSMGNSMSQCAKNGDCTHTYDTHFGNTVGLLAPMFNPTYLNSSVITRPWATMKLTECLRHWTWDSEQPFSFPSLTVNWPWILRAWKWCEQWHIGKYPLLWYKLTGCYGECQTKGSWWTCCFYLLPLCCFGLDKNWEWSCNIYSCIPSMKRGLSFHNKYSQVLVVKNGPFHCNFILVSHNHISISLSITSFIFTLLISHTNLSWSSSWWR